MTNGPKVQKAMIFPVNDLNAAVICQFNPAKFSISKEMNWVEKPDIGGIVPDVVFGGGRTQELTVDLFFDSTDTGEDVRIRYMALKKMTWVSLLNMNLKTGKGSPPRCLFQWGKFLAFTAVIKRITEDFSLFKADGTPLRADVKVTFQEVKLITKGQNPTTRSEPTRVWVVHQEERLDWIAYREYGDPAYWRHIAETNDLANPMDLRPGQVLRLVPLP
jgi:hypothetical protein